MSLTKNQVRVLRLVATMKNPFTGVRTKREIAGRARTLNSLVAAKLIFMNSRFFDFLTTAAGKRALEKAKP